MKFQYMIALAISCTFGCQSLPGKILPTNIVNIKTDTSDETSIDEFESSDLTNEVREEKLENGSCKYTFKGLALDKKKVKIDSYSYPISEYTKEKISQLKVDYSGRTISFITDKPLEIKEWVDKQANLWGVFPYWAEYKTRDSKSPNFDKKLFPNYVDDLIEINLGEIGREYSYSAFSEVKKLAPYLYQFELTHTSIKSGKSLKSSFYISFNDENLRTYANETSVLSSVMYPKLPAEQVIVPIKNECVGDGQLLLNRERAVCMCHDSYMMRLFVGEQYVWGYRVLPDHYGISICTADLDNDGCDEIIMFQYTGGNYGDLRILSETDFSLNGNKSSVTPVEFLER